MVQSSNATSPSPHPVVRDLLAAGEGKTLAISGYVGPAAEGRVRLYADLGLRTWIELGKADVVRVIDGTGTPPGPSTLLFRRDAEITYVQAMTLRADQALSAALAAPVAAGSGGGCGCGGADAAGSIARQSGGGPVVDLCSWGCSERLQLCLARSGSVGRLWCLLNYGFCRLGCIDPPVIAA